MKNYRSHFSYRAFLRRLWTLGIPLFLSFASSKSWGYEVRVQNQLGKTISIVGTTNLATYRVPAGFEIIDIPADTYAVHQDTALGALVGTFSLSPSSITTEEEVTLLVHWNLLETVGALGIVTGMSDRQLFMAGFFSMGFFCGVGLMIHVLKGIARTSVDV